MKEDKYIKYLKLHYQEHGTINDIDRNYVVIFEDEPLKVGEFFATIRRQHRLYKKGRTDRGCASPLTLNRYQELDMMEFVWEPGAVKAKQLEERDIKLEYVMNYYDEHHTFEGLPDKVIIDGVEQNIVSFISHTRTNHKNYINGTNSKGSDSKTALRRYAELDKRGFEWEPKLNQQKAFEADDKAIRYLEKYYREHGSLDNVPKTVIFEGEELDIQKFLADRRKKHRKRETDPTYKPSKLELKRQDALDKMNYDWEFHKHQKESMLENDPYIRYLQIHHQQHGTINDIKPRDEVEFEGKILKIGVFVNDLRKKHYAYTTKAIKAPSVTSPLALKRYQELEKLGIDWRPSETSLNLKNHAQKNNIKLRTLKKYLELFNGDLDKATKICVASRKYNTKKTQPTKKTSPKFKTIMQEFEINIDTLVSLLLRPSLRTKETTNQPLKVDENTNLREFCIANGLNYTLIQKAIDLKQKDLCDEDLQSLINRTITQYKKAGQQRPATWIYTKYGNETLVRHLLLSMNLDHEAILRDMTKNQITIEEAIENDCFRRHSKQDDYYLKPIYHEIIAFYNKINTSPEYTPETAVDALIDCFKEMIDNYSLTEQEFNIIKDAYIHYTKASETYKLYNVAFEKDAEKKVQKIINYKLDDEEIEEAFFLPLRFDQKVLIGEASEMYNRRSLIKNLTVGWNQTTEEERIMKEKMYNLTQQELEYITTTRKSIDQVKEKVHSHK